MKIIIIYLSYNYNLFKLTDIGDFVGIEGKVFKTKTDALTIKVS